jgi:hypothetical protein
MNQIEQCLMKAGNSLEYFYIYIFLVQIAVLSEANSTSYSRLSVLKTIPELRPFRYLDHLIKERYFLFFMSMVTWFRIKTTLLIHFKNHQIHSQIPYFNLFLTHYILRPLMLNSTPTCNKSKFVCCLNALWHDGVNNCYWVIMWNKVRK